MKNKNTPQRENSKNSTVKITTSGSAKKAGKRSTKTKASEQTQNEQDKQGKNSALHKIAEIRATLSLRASMIAEAFKPTKKQNFIFINSKMRSIVANTENYKNLIKLVGNYSAFHDSAELLATVFIANEIRKFEESLEQEVEKLAQDLDFEE